MEVNFFSYNPASFFKVSHFVLVQFTTESAENAEKRPEGEKPGRWEIDKLNLPASQLPQPPGLFSTFGLSGGELFLPFHNTFRKIFKILYVLMDPPIFYHREKIGSYPNCESYNSGSEGNDNIAR